MADTTVTVYTKDHRVVKATRAGLALCTKVKDDDFLLVDNVEVEQLEWVVGYCDAVAANPDAGAAEWRPRVLAMTVSERHTLAAAAELLGATVVVDALAAAAATEAAQTYTLVCEGGATLTVTKAVLRMNKTLDNMAAACPGAAMLPVPALSAATLQQVVEFCEQYIANACVKEEWVTKVMGMVNTDVAVLYKAADFLDNAACMDVCARGIANRLQSMSVEEMREYIGDIPVGDAEGGDAEGGDADEGGNGNE